VEDKLKANAELVVQQMSKVADMQFGYDRQSIEWLEGFIERQRTREDINQDKIDGMISTLGSYLGETIIRCHGGKWKNVDGQWCVQLNEGGSAFPFNKVRKQFANGREDSIGSFFDVIPKLSQIRNT